MILFGEGEAAGFVEGEDEDAGLGGLDDGFLREGVYRQGVRRQQVEEEEEVEVRMKLFDSMYLGRLYRRRC